MRFISIGEGSKELLFYGCSIGGDARCKTNQRRRPDGLVSTNVDGVHDAAPLGGVALLYEYSAAQEVLWPSPVMNRCQLMSLSCDMLIFSIKGLSWPRAVNSRA